MTRLTNEKLSLTSIAFALLWAGSSGQAISGDLIWPRDLRCESGARQVVKRDHFDATASMSERWLPKCPHAPEGDETVCSPPASLQGGMAQSTAR